MNNRTIIRFIILVISCVVAVTEMIYQLGFGETKTMLLRFEIILLWTFVILTRD